MAIVMAVTQGKNLAEVHGLIESRLNRVIKGFNEKQIREGDLFWEFETLENAIAGARGKITLKHSRKKASHHTSSLMSAFFLSIYFLYRK